MVKTLKLEELENIENLIKSGQSELARKKLQRANVSKISRNRIHQYALLCRRAGLAEQAIKALRPIVRSKNSQVKPKPQEVAIYANALAGIGGSDEAIKLLTQDWVLESEPMAHLYLAFAYFSKWNYAESIPHLEAFLRRSKKNSYSYFIGQVNFVAALITLERHEEALEILLPLETALMDRNHTVLAGNCKELKAQIYFHTGKLEAASKLLKEALELSGDKYPDALFAAKWLGLTNVKVQKENQGKSPELSVKLETVREKALEFHHWETLRDMDLNLAKIDNDEDLFWKVYFGSPFPQFRKTLLDRNNKKAPKEFVRHLNGSNSKTILKVNDLHNGQNAIFKGGSLYQRLFHILASDFYRPQRIPKIFSELYSDEYFDPEYSPKKVVMLISRLRKLLEKVDIEIKEYGGNGYSIASDSSLALVYSLEDLGSLDQTSFRLKKIEDEFTEELFTCKQAAELFKVNNRTALRWLKELEEEGFLQKFGVKKGVRYQVAYKKDSGKQSA